MTSSPLSALIKDVPIKKKPVTACDGLFFDQMFGSYKRSMPASPRKLQKPMASVIVVRKIDDA